MAGIKISVSAGTSKEASSVQASGSVQHIITDDERNTFGLQDADLKAAVNSYFGKAPNDAYLHSPTPWNDLYNTYGWPQVQTILQVQSAEIIEVTSTPAVVAQNAFKNNSNLPGTFTVGVSTSVTDTVENNWSSTYTFGVSQTISYGISFLGSGGGGETSFSFQAAFGEGGSRSTSVTVGSEQSVSVNLQPGESVDAVLTASKGKMKVRVTYKVSLTGNTAVNYNPTYKDHHFWCFDINQVLNAAGKATSFTITEDMEIGYFVNTQTVLENPTAKAALAQVTQTA